MVITGSDHHLLTGVDGDTEEGGRVVEGHEVDYEKVPPAGSILMCSEGL